MNKTFRSRLVGGVLSAVFAVGLLPVSAAATDTTYVAQVGEVQYTTLLDAVAEAKKLTDADRKVVTLLGNVAAADVDDPATTDVAETTLDLGDVALLVPEDGTVNNTADKLIEITGITITGTRADYLVKNEGHLLLRDVTITNANEEAGVAVYTAAPEALPAVNTEEPEPAELTIIGGSYTGVYAVGVQEGYVNLNRTATSGEGENAEPVLGPVAQMNGTAADFLVEQGGGIVVMADLGKDTAYTVEARTTAAVAHMSVDSVTVEPVAGWFVGTKASASLAEGSWTMTAAIADGDVTLDQTQFTYTGRDQHPVVTVKVEDTVLVQDTDYTLTCQPAESINAGDYTLTITGTGCYTGTVTKTFTISAAAQAALEITGTVSSAVYGMDPIRLGTSGGTGDGAVTWELTKGSDIAAIDAAGELTVKGAGTVAVKAVKAASDGYDAATAEWSIDVQPATLTVSGITAADKAYDGKNTVTVSAVELSGILNNDDVKVNTDGLTGTLSGTGVAVYEAVTLGTLTLTGAAKDNYTLTQPDKAIATEVTVSKAAAPTLEAVEVTLPVSTTSIEVDVKAAGMPEDAGTVTFLRTNDQSTSTGSKVIVHEWAVDASTGKLTARVTSAVAGDQVMFTVAACSEHYSNAPVKVTVTLGAEAVDSSKLTVTPAATSLTYNGADQKPAVTVKYGDTTLTSGTDYEVTYPSDCKSVGEKELTVTLKGSYSGSATAKYTITKAKVTVSGGSVSDKTYDGTKTASVNLGTVSGTVKGDDVAVKAAGLFADKNSGTGKKVSVTYSLSGTAAGNYELETTSATLTGRIYAISSGSLSNRLGSLTTANVTSSNKQTLNDVIYLCNVALEDTGLTGSERSSITAVKADAETMLSRVETAAAAVSTQSIQATEDVTKDNVQLSDQAALTKAQSDINTALTTYSGNYTTGEKKEIETDKTRVADALAVVTKVDSADQLISALPEDYTTVTTQTVEAVTAAGTAYSGLSDYGKSLLDQAQVEKLTAALEAIDGVVPTEVPEDGLTTTITGVKNDTDKQDTIKFPTWIILIALVLAAGAGGGYYWYYKKQQETEEEEEFFN